MHNAGGGRYDVIIVGGGISGLSAALRAADSGLRPLLLEKEAITGGVWRSVYHDGFVFDIGVHGLYAANKANEQIVGYLQGLVKDGFVGTEKKTKILFKGKLLNYPLVAGEFFSQYGAEGIGWALTLLWARFTMLFRGSAWMKSFKDYIEGNFGRKLYRIYFDPYVAKVWGADPSTLSLEAIARRVRRIRVREFVWNLLKKRLHLGRREAYEGLQPAQFLYPRDGAGTVVDALRRLGEERGAVVRTEACPTGIEVRPDGDYAVKVALPGKEELEVTCGHLISTIPLPDLLRLLYPEDPYARRLIEGLRYRAIRMLCLLLDMDRVFDAQWIYFQGAEFSFSRINEFKNLSPAFCPEGKTSLAIEFNCEPDGDVWCMPDEQLVEQTLRELDTWGGLGQRLRGAIRQSFSVYEKHAYPVMQVETHGILEEAQRHVSRFPNIYSIGRQGGYAYVNGDECVKWAFETVDQIHQKGDVCKR